MTLQQLKYIIAAADKSSMNEAAKSLFVSQPSLSNSIKELETEIGIAIFSRNNKGIEVTREGKEFLGYARQVIEQADLLEEKYLGSKPHKKKFSVSTQHYSFAVEAFVELVKKYGMDEYEFSLRETKTYEIIDDVRNLGSEIGILYLNEFNEKVILKLLNESGLIFKELFQARPHIFIWSGNPLANKYMKTKQKITLEELEEYPCISFEQGEYNSFYFSEEILSTIEHKRAIKVNDRATLSNLLIGLNGYTICTGIISEQLNGRNIISVPLDVDETMRIGIITHKDVTQSRIAEVYLEGLLRAIEGLQQIT